MNTDKATRYIAFLVEVTCDEDAVRLAGARDYDSTDEFLADRVASLTEALDSAIRDNMDDDGFDTEVLVAFDGTGVVYPGKVVT